MKIARYFVLQFGRDCDGCESFGLTGFADKAEAKEYHKNVVDGSDGVSYKLTSNWDEVVQYCED